MEAQDTGREPSFRERKLAELGQETARFTDPTPQPDVAAEATPTESLESAREEPVESLSDSEIEPEQGLVEEGEQPQLDPGDSAALSTAQDPKS